MSKISEFAVEILKQYAKENSELLRTTTDTSPLEQWLIIQLYKANQAEPQVSLDAKLMLLAKDIVEKYGLGCPNCNDEGFIVVNGGSFIEPEREQCEFCYYEPKSRFNLMADLEKLIKVSKQSN